MDDTLHMQYLILGGLLLFGFLSAKLISVLKRRKNNVPLWSTVFEGITMGLVNLDMYKEPEARIEKRAKRDGKNDPAKDLIDQNTLSKSDKY